MLPGSVARFSAKRVGLKILPVKVPTVLGSVNVITVKNRTPSPLAQLFIGSARAVAKWRRHRDVSPRPPQPGEMKAQLQLGRPLTMR